MGNDNVGNRNVGDYNVGDRNVGYWNVGDYNAGNCNVGGYRNVGNWNVGDYNVGDCNVGYCNVGDRNVGNWNVGDYNLGDCNVGHFNTTTPELINIFNKPCERSVWDVCIKPDWIYFYLTLWISESTMTQKEKDDHPTYKTTGGYLKSYTYKEAWANAYKEATDADIALTLKLPNFDYDVFEEISGIDLRKHGRQTCANKVVEIDGKKYKLTEVEG